MRVRVLSVLLVLSFVLGPGAGAQEATDVSGAIGGRVTDDAGVALYRACVRVELVEPEWKWETSVQTRPDGTYWVTGLRPGSYAISIDGCSARDVESLDGAGPIAVELGRATTFDASLPRLGRISGVVASDTGQGVDGACVTAWPADTQGSSLMTPEGYTVTDPTGRYSLPVNNGAHRIEFRPCTFETLDLVPAWYPSAAVYEEADAVVVEGYEDVDGIDGVMITGGRISGTVTGPAGVPFDHACVSAESGASYALTGTDADGTYLIRGLAPGEAKVRFRHCPWQYEDIHFAPEWYDDAPDRASATAVPVSSGQTTGGIDASMVVGGSITGSVVRADGAFVYTCVAVHDLAGGLVASAGSSGGRYRVGGLPAGEYVVRFQDCQTPSSEPVWWDGRSDIGSADPVVVHLGAETSGIDAVLPLAEPPAPSELIIEDVFVLRELQEHGLTSQDLIDRRRVWVDTRVSGHPRPWWNPMRIRLGACPATAGSCRTMYHHPYGYGPPNDIEAEATAVLWEPRGAGSFTLHVTAMLSGFGVDQASVDHDVVLHDTGVGVGI